MQVKYTAEVVSDTTAPNGETAKLVRCTCATHRTGNEAIMTAASIAAANSVRSAIHTAVVNAHGPLAPVLAKRSGPWAA